jgi:hypothetical protein
MKKIILVLMSSLILLSFNVKAGAQYGNCADIATAPSNPHCSTVDIAALNTLLNGGAGTGTAILGGPFITPGDLNDAIRGLEQGISVSSAIASIPKLDRDKIFSIGVGFGGMGGQSAAAVGASARISDHFVVNGNVGHGLGSTYSNISTTVWGAGGALSW